MKKPLYGQTIYYQDELNDDFANTSINAEKITSDYRYFIQNPFARLGSFLLLYLIAIPIINLMNWFRFGIRVHGRPHLRGIRTGYILYGNHTHHYDAFIPQAIIARPRKTYIIAHPDAVSIPFVKYLTKGLGAWPLPDTVKGTMRFLEAIERALKQKRVIAVYPEAHIWPYYTKIRPYKATSFQYAARNLVPAVPMVTTFRRPKGCLKAYRKPLMDIHIGVPIYPDPTLTVKENAAMLHERTLAFMNEYASRPDNVAFYEYVKKNAD
ncbi:MAG: lysophospholipid acyltransferase family protein [Bacilli bacterium]|jgi:1-acyl-sn-glycerol-3-phosphate acyltransferase